MRQEQNFSQGSLLNRIPGQTKLHNSCEHRSIDMSKKESIKRVLCVLPMFTGMSPYFYGQAEEPMGMPPVFKFLQALSLTDFKVKLFLPHDESLYPGQKLRPWAFNTIQVTGVRVVFRDLVRRLNSYHIPNPMIFGLLRNLILFIDIYRKALKFKPHVIYAAEDMVLPAWLSAQMFSCPIISRFYGTLILETPSKISKAKNENTDSKVLANTNEIKVLKFWSSHTLEAISMKLPVKYVIMTNDGTRGLDALKRLGVPETRIKFWQNGIDKELTIGNDPLDKEAFLKKQGLEPDSLIIMAVSRLVDWKRVDRIINALPKVIANEPRSCCIIIGNGPEHKNLAQLAKNLGLEQHVIFLKQLPHSEVIRHLKVCDIFISVYDFSNLANPVREAMLCGKPVISLADGSLNGIIENNQTGILLNLVNLRETLPVTIIRLLGNPVERERLGKNAGEYVLNHFPNWEERIEHEIALIY